MVQLSNKGASLSTWFGVNQDDENLAQSVGVGAQNGMVQIADERQGCAVAVQQAAAAGDDLRDE